MAPARGYVRFRSLLLHPAACLLSWFILLLAVQLLSWPALAVLALLVALAGGGVCRRWWRLLRRARWLLLSLFLILAYGAPGDALFDVAWLPTEAGVADGALHVLRLVVMLGSLAWVFERLSRDQFLAGIWGLSLPLARLGIDSRRAVVRLALVFDIVQEAPRPGNWRQLLEDGSLAEGESAVVRIASPAWRAADTALVAGMVGLMLGASWLR